MAHYCRLPPGSTSRKRCSHKDAPVPGLDKTLNWWWTEERQLLTPAGLGHNFKDAMLNIFTSCIPEEPPCTLLNNPTPQKILELSKKNPEKKTWRSSGEKNPEDLQKTTYLYSGLSQRIHFQNCVFYHLLSGDRKTNLWGQKMTINICCINTQKL